MIYLLFVFFLLAVEDTDYFSLGVEGDADNGGTALEFAADVDAVEVGEISW